MQVKNDTPFPFATKATSTAPPQAQMVVVVRGRFRLVPEGPAVALEPAFEGDLITQGALTADLYDDDDPDRLGGPTYPGDVADFKLNAEVLLHGTCHPPRAGTTSCDVRCSVGEWSKQLSVIGPRAWSDQRAGAIPSDPLPFDSMPLTYANAFGGEGIAENPLGLGLDDRLPTIEHPANRIRNRSDRPRPAGFAALNPQWPQRLQHIGEKWGEEYQRTRAPWYAEDFSFRALHAAPEDQQLKGYLRGDEPYTLRHLHPRWPVLSGALPGLRVRAFAKRKGEALVEVPMRLDTLLLEPDEDRMTLTWRGLTPVAEDDLVDVETLLIAAEPLGQAEPLDGYAKRVDAFEADPLGFEAAGVPGLRAEADAAHAKLDTVEEALMAMGQNGEAALGGDLNRLMTAIRGPGEAGSAPGGLDEALGKRRAQNPDAPDVAAAFREGLSRPSPQPAMGLKVPAADAPLKAPDIGASLAATDGMLVGAEASIDDAKLAADVDHPTPSLTQPLREVLDDPALAGVAPRQPIEPGPGLDLREQDYRGRDLSGADLRGANLEGALLSGATLRGARLDEANLSHAVLEGADLTDASLERARMELTGMAGITAVGTSFRGAHFERAMLEQADLSGADLRDSVGSYVVVGEARGEKSDWRGARWADSLFERCVLPRLNASGATFERCIWLACELDDADFSGVQLTRTSFDASVLARASLREARGRGVAFEGVTLDRADLERAVLPQAHLQNASLRHAKLRGANLTGSMLYRATLDHADMSAANLFRADLRKASLHHASFRGANLFEAVLLQAAGRKVDFDDANITRARLP